LPLGVDVDSFGGVSTRCVTTKDDVRECGLAFPGARDDNPEIDIAASVRWSDLLLTFRETRL
jgi:hypothetical protein